MVAWICSLPVALWLPGAVDRSPFTLQGSAPPLVAGVLLLGIGLLGSWRRPGEATAGVAAGIFGAWVALTMHTGLHGTPYGFSDGDDAIRLSAMAERYTTTVHSADGVVGAVPSEYPPLFPWLVGRTAVILGVPAWRLLGTAETLVSSASVVAGFVIWRRMLPAWVALTVTLATFVVFSNPAKPYELMALVLTVPWALATFTAHPGRRLCWIAAGVIGGLLISLYPGYLMFVGLGLLGLIVATWRAAPDRRRYARHVLGVTLVALLVSAWYLGPYLLWALQHGLQETDRYQAPLIAGNPFPFLDADPLGVLCAIGVTGLVWYRRRTWWAIPLLALTLSAYVYRFAAEALFVEDGVTLVFQYTVYVISATLAAAGVLSVVTAGPALMRRLDVSPPSGLGALGLGALVAWVGVTGWYDWLPAPGTLDPAMAPYNSLLATGYRPSLAFQTPLPDGASPSDAPGARLAWFPTTPIVDDVRRVRGDAPAPLTVSWNETLFATQPWPGFVAVGANAAPGSEHWSSRVRELQALSDLSSPRAFARDSAHTPWGDIGAFVLRRQGDRWWWSALNNPAAIAFRPAQFASSAFVTFTGLPDDTVLVVRRET